MVPIWLQFMEGCVAAWRVCGCFMKSQLWRQKRSQCCIRGAVVLQPFTAPEPKVIHFSPFV